MSAIGSVSMFLYSSFFPAVSGDLGPRRECLSGSRVFATRSAQRDQHQHGLLPARFEHTGDVTAECEESKTNSAQLELAVVTASTAANLATVAMTHREFRGAIE